MSTSRISAVGPLPFPHRIAPNHVSISPGDQRWGGHGMDAGDGIGQLGHAEPPRVSSRRLREDGNRALSATTGLPASSTATMADKLALRVNAVSFLESQLGIRDDSPINRHVLLDGVGQGRRWPAGWRDAHVFHLLDQAGVGQCSVDGLVEPFHRRRWRINGGEQAQPRTQDEVLQAALRRSGDVGQARGTVVSRDGDDLHLASVGMGPCPTEPVSG